MKWRYYRTGLYTEKKRSHWLEQWPIRKGLGDKKGELSLVEDVIWTSSKRWNSQSMESLRGIGDLQGANEFFVFAEKRIQRFDESRFQGGEMKWNASSNEDRAFVLIVMKGTLGVVKKMLTDGGIVKLSGTGVLTRAGKPLTDVWRGRIGNRFWDVLFDSLF